MGWNRRALADLPPRFYLDEDVDEVFIRLEGREEPLAVFASKGVKLTHIKERAWEIYRRMRVRGV